MVFGTSLWVFQKVHGTARAVNNKAVPAIIEALAAKEALVKADAAAIDSFQSREVLLTGPGQQYQNQLAFASQSLAQVAEDNAAGVAGSQTIQLAETLLVSYSGLIGQADANYRKGTGTALGASDLWYASRLLGATPDSGIIDQLNVLLDRQKEALNTQLSASAMTPWTVFVWVLPIVFLLFLLCATHIFLKRHFRRTVNPLLLLATVFLIGLSMVTSVVFVSQHRLENSQKELYRLVDDWNAQTSAAQIKRQQDLVNVVTSVCQQEGVGCGVTVARSAPDPAPEDGVSEIKAPERIMNIKQQIEAADRNGSLWPLIPLLVALIAVLIPLGLRSRIDEYRYRPR
ncbi:MAG: hypothetical protein LC799_01055 [Actinobacteria bacterium]|nr:hypothetical protein [Actinomycetota bacterium]